MRMGIKYGAITGNSYLAYNSFLGHGPVKPFLPPGNDVVLLPYLRIVNILEFSRQDVDTFFALRLG
jgi:hypothetical protein